MHGIRLGVLEVYIREEKVQLASLAFIIKIHDVVTSRPTYYLWPFQDVTLWIFFTKIDSSYIIFKNENCILEKGNFRSFHL